MLYVLFAQCTRQRTFYVLCACQKVLHSHRFFCTASPLLPAVQYYSKVQCCTVSPLFAFLAQTGAPSASTPVHPGALTYLHIPT